jgi:hypothetical protein
MAQDENVLHLIPGEIIAAADDGFPPAETCKGGHREVIVDVAGRFRAKIRFEPFHFKRGKMNRWFWHACGAERVD